MAQDVFSVGKAVEKATEPIADLVKRLAGPAADEIGLTLQDSVKVYRAKRQYRLFEKLKMFFEKRGTKPNPVSLKLLLPALDYASVEDDENLHSMWARLVSSAAVPDAKPKPYPAFVECLRQLSKEEAVFFSSFFADNKLKVLGRNSEGSGYPVIGHFGSLEDLYFSANGIADPPRESRTAFIISLENMVRLGLFMRDNESIYHLTGFALMFGCLCCHDPGCWERTG